jgi:hypothetical protein
VERRQHSLSSLRRVREEIGRTLEQRAAETGRPILPSIGEGKGVISVALRADQENLAGELAARYGSAVELRVGAFSFPGRRRSHPQPPVRPAPEEQIFEGLEMSVEVGQRVLEAGDDGHGRLVLRNSGPERIGPLGSGQPLAGSLLHASLETVGRYSGWIAGTGLALDLAPGRSASIPVIYGTASTREDLGYALPPGTYWLKVRMRFRHGLGGPPTNALTAPLTQITIIPRVRPHRGASPEPIDLPPSHPLRRAVAYVQRNRTIVLALPLVFCGPTVAARRPAVPVRSESYGESRRRGGQIGGRGSFARRLTPGRS